MNFLRLLDPRLFQDYKNCVLSIGTYQSNSFDQMLYAGPIDDTIVIAIDPEYYRKRFYEETLFIQGRKYRSFNDFIQAGNPLFISIYKCIEARHPRHLVVFIPQRLLTDYPEASNKDQGNFSYSFHLTPQNLNWIKFKDFLLHLIDLEYTVYINNWAFTNSRVELDINGHTKMVNQTIGTHFEYFPELGCILKQIYPRIEKSPRIFITIQPQIKRIDKLEFR